MAYSIRSRHLLRFEYLSCWFLCADMEDLKAFAKESASPEANDLAHWDLSFWSERLRESKYDINEVLSLLSRNV